MDKDNLDMAMNIWNECVLDIEKGYKTCIDEAGGDKALARRLFEIIFLESLKSISVWKRSLPYLKSTAKKNSCESIQIVQEFMDSLTTQQSVDKHVLH